MPGITRCRAFEVRETMPIFGTKDAQGNLTLHVTMGDGISTIGKGLPVCLTLIGNRYLGIKQRFSKTDAVVLKCSQITDIQRINENDFFVIGRNLPTKGAKNALPGGRRPEKHGSKTQKSSKIREYIVINYAAATNKVITFETIVGTTIGAQEFIAEVMSLANNSPQANTEVQIASNAP
jgi:hypothetical protein